MDSHDQAVAAPHSASAAPLVEVFWRPGCPYCRSLRGMLLDYDVESKWRNIWEDPEARDIVRAANRGNETVPTVKVGSRTLTNSGWCELAPLIGRDPSERPRPLAPRPYASAGACTPAPGPSPSARKSPAVGWVGLTIFVGVGVALAGHVLIGVLIGVGVLGSAAAIAQRSRR